MLIKVRIDGRYADEELRSLYTWLRQEPEIRRNVELDLATEGPLEGKMGDGLDLITLAVTGTLAFPAFIHTIANWRHNRRREYQVTVEIGDKKVVVPDADKDLILKIVEEFDGSN
ncbi:hypothetical protein [Spirillospora sp. NPDC029432]|uniref:effector-associated constant component EACC1 n=1 Tax=Spirillospora sp. NPDC029432 TaxID=3154599 RepID=UPI003457097E